MTPSPFPYLTALPGIVGRVALVGCPGDPAAIDDDVLARLHPEEAAFARSLRGWSRHDFVAGRVAAHHLLGDEGGPVLRGGGGEPLFPAGWSGSIAHKKQLAGALIAPADPTTTLGLDLEHLAAPTRALERRVITPAEHQTLPEPRRLAVIATFAVKEATYKALWPRLHRFVAFAEATVELAPAIIGPARVQLDLAGGEGPFQARALVEVVAEHVVATVVVEGR